MNLLLDIVPTHYLYAHVTREFVDAYFRWFLFIRPAPFPENVIAATGMFIGGGPGETGAAMCEDYRAAAGIDTERDEADIAAGRKIQCPLNVPWGGNAPTGRQYAVLDIEKQEGARVEGKAMPGGHTFQDSPAETAAEVRRFLSAV